MEKVLFFVIFPATLLIVAILCCYLKRDDINEWESMNTHLKKYKHFLSISIIVFWASIVFYAKELLEANGYFWDTAAAGLTLGAIYLTLRVIKRLEIPWLYYFLS